MSSRNHRLLFLTPAAGAGGAEAALGDLLAAVHAARPGWVLRVLALEDGPLLDHVRSRLGPSAAAVLPVPEAWRQAGEASGRVAKLRAGMAGVNVLRALGRELRGWRPDLVHSNGMKTHLLAALALRLPGVVPRPRPGLVWQFHDYPGSRRGVRPLLRPLARGCDAALAVSGSVGADVRETFGERLPVRVAHNAIDLDHFTPHGPALDLDGLAGLPPAAPGTVRVGLVATFARWKGHGTFLRAAAAVLREWGPGPPVRFYVVGGPIYATVGSQHTTEELRAEARAAGLRETDVGFTGFVADAAAAMRALDVVVHASTRPEPFGLVLAQAMACGRALVTSGLGGAAEVVRPEVDALRHRAGDADDLAAVILRLVGDADRRGRLGQAGRNTAGRFSREALAATVVPVYEGLLERR